ncbi:MAG: hypothetical protein O2931_05140 [Planctomycetota bacterium]|nr:hypothetical protein [Planctomycetota bacterium]MDA1178167.1 hypothetical protein [Planctomycetota bacterium]
MPQAAQPNMLEAMKIRTSLQKASGVAEEPEEKVVAEPTGFVSLRGTFKLRGEAPPLSTVSTLSADCRGLTETVPIEDFVVDPQTKGIANILIVADIPYPSWVHESARTPKEPEAIFDQGKCNFKTHVLGVHTGQVLKVLNSDPFGHNTKFAPPKNPSLNEMVSSAGLKYQPKVSEKDPFAVSCSVHPWMKAYIVFRDNGYFAVTRPDGSFEIQNLPAGVPVNFKVWQEKSKGLPSVDIASPAPLVGKQFKKGKFTLTLDANDPSANQLDVTVDLSSFQ